MSKKISITIIATLCTLSVFAQRENVIVGKWINSSGEAQIEVFKVSHSYYGKIISIKEPNDENGKPMLDVKNPNSNLRQKAILGLTIVKDLVFEGDKWIDGTVYDPKTGKTYNANITMDGLNKLNMRGYIGLSIIGRTEVWKRVK